MNLHIVLQASDVTNSINAAEEDTVLEILDDQWGHSGDSILLYVIEDDDVNYQQVIIH